MSNELASFYSVRPGHTDMAIPGDLRRHVQVRVEGEVKMAREAGAGGSSTVGGGSNGGEEGGGEGEGEPHGGAKGVEGKPRGGEKEEGTAAQGEGGREGDAAWRWCVQHVLFPGEGRRRWNAKCRLFASLRLPRFASLLALRAPPCLTAASALAETAVQRLGVLLIQTFLNSASHCFCLIPTSRRHEICHNASAIVFVRRDSRAARVHIAAVPRV